MINSTTDLSDEEKIIYLTLCGWRMRTNWRGLKYFMHKDGHGMKYMGNYWLLNQAYDYQLSLNK